jgi:hypothetical protein
MILIVTDIGAEKPIHCESLPITDIYLARGPTARSSPFRSRKYLRSEVEVLWPDATGRSSARRRRTSGSGTRHHRRLLARLVRPRQRDLPLRRAVQRQDHLPEGIQGRRLSCPFIVARWSRDNTTAWGVGPTYRVLPAIKTLNHFLSDLKNYDKHVDP